MDLSKYASRKFLLSLAAFLASFGGAMLGYFSGIESVTAVGFICMALSAGIYSAAETYVDGKSASSDTTVTTINASTTAKDVVVSAIEAKSGGAQ